MRRLFLMAILGMLTLPTLAHGDVITQWNFNFGNDATSGTGTTVASTGSGTIGLIGATTATFAGGTLTPSQSTDPAQGPDNSAWNLTTFSSSAQFSDGLQVLASTVGYDNITISWDQRFSNTSSQFAAVFYTLDGSTWTQATGSMFTAGTISGTLNPNGDSIVANLFASGSGDRFHNQRTVDFSSIAGAANNANFGFRIVSAFDPATGGFRATNSASFSPNGTWRFDMITVNGSVAIPEPSVFALLGLAGIAITAMRRRR